MSPTLVPDPTQLHLVCLTASQTTITMIVSTKPTTALCPLCQQPSDRRHSRYQRTLADLPWNGIAVQIQLQTRRFFCDNDACQRRIFTERLPTVAGPYARRTMRLATWLTHPQRVPELALDPRKPSRCVVSLLPDSCAMVAA